MQLATATLTLLTAMTVASRSGAQTTGDAQTSESASVETKAPWAKWSGAAGILYYSEEGRVSAFEPTLEMIATFDDDRKWTNRLVIDSLTGPSHNGGVPSRNPQTFTSPSGSTYVVNPGQLPLDGSFRDTRVSYSSSWSQPLGSDYEVVAGGLFSNEYDFRSLGVNTSVSRYSHRKNTKLTLGFSMEYDQVRPVGGSPVGLSDMVAQNKTGDKSKSVYDFLLGVTQIINRRWIVQGNYSLGMSDGYHTDPYKLLTEVEAPASGNAGDPTGDYFFEKRPPNRAKNSFYLSSKYSTVKSQVLTAHIRYFWDDWGMTSETVGLDYRLPIGSGWFITPDIRYYHQKAADFYHYFLIDGQALPKFASADGRLGEMKAYTIGVKVGQRLEGDNEWAGHLQYYEQSGDGHPTAAYGNLIQQDLSPKLKTLIFRAIYTF